MSTGATLALCSSGQTGTNSQFACLGSDVYSCKISIVYVQHFGFSIVFKSGQLCAFPNFQM